jgi:gliding motility-associated-like protein
LGLVNPAVSITLGQVTNPTACGVCDGSIKITNLAANQTDTVRYQVNGVWQAYNLFPVNQDGTITLVNLCPAQYDSLYVTIGVSTSCVSNYIGPDSLNGGGLNPAFTYNIHHNCAGSDTVYFSNTTGLYTRWHFGDGTMDSITNPVHIYDTAGTYSVTMYVSNQTCTDSLTKTIDTRHPIAALFTLSPGDTICQGSVISFTNGSIGGNPSYVWNLGDGTSDRTDITPPQHIYKNAGVYQVSLIEEDTLACLDTFVQALYVDSNAAVSILASDTSICAGKQVVFTAVYTRIGSHGISWNFGDGYTAGNSNPVTHVFDTPADSTVITLNAVYRACPDTFAKKAIYIRPYPLVNLGPDTSLCPGGTPINIADYINAATPGAKWNWNTGDTTSGIVVSQPGLYYTTVTIGGCDNADSVNVYKDCYIDIPNAFTPNNDGVNDYFFPRNLLTSGVTSFKMEIYNRWGQQIFETENSDGLGWDGKFNNIPQPEGVYVYIIDVSFKNGKKEHHQGNVSLLK